MPKQSNEKPSRPKEDDAMRVFAALSIVSEMRPYGFPDIDGKEDQELAEQLATAYRRSFGRSGYDIAKELDDRLGWSPNAEMVECLDGLSSAIAEEVRKAGKEWAARHQITPKFKAGDRVSAIWGGETIIGIVREVYEHIPASYSIQREGDDKNRGAICYFEDTKAA